ncbi:hypothetical protein [Paenibacillus sp. MMS18-CY102]|uniref:hypothetical protein n=1 Tax=Paenibacillus sp. MMS18-CY102 TaxID=2682849 RepID=UPI003FA6B33B
MDLKLQITKESNQKNKQYIEDELYRFNLKHFPADLGGRYEEICVFLKDGDGSVRGGILGEVCWNWRGDFMRSMGIASLGASIM